MTDKKSVSFPSLDLLPLFLPEAKRVRNRQQKKGKKLLLVKLRFKNTERVSSFLGRGSKEPVITKKIMFFPSSFF